MTVITFCLCSHNHKKWTDSREGGHDRVVFAAKLDFPKALVPWLPENTLNVSIDSVGKSEQLYFVCDQRLGALISYFNVFNLCFLIGYA